MNTKPKTKVKKKKVRKSYYGHRFFPTNKLAVCTRFFSLATGACLLATFFAILAVYYLVMIFLAESPWSKMAHSVNCFFNIIVAFGGYMATFHASSLGAQLLFVGYGVTIVKFSVALFTGWISLFMKFFNGSELEENEIEGLVLNSFLWILMILVSCSIVFSLVGSFKMVLSVGGNGRERKDFVAVGEDVESRNLKMMGDEEKMKLLKTLDGLELVQGKDFKTIKSGMNSLEFQGQLETIFSVSDSEDYTSKPA